MKTITLNIDDDIFDKFLVLLDLLPTNKIRISDKEKNENIPFVSQEEQEELENLLEDPECHEFSGHETTIEI